jgi:protease PrsW
MTSSGILLLSIAAATLPILLYIGLIYWVDHYEKEPAWLLLATFAWGAIPSILFAYLFNTLFSIPVFWLAGEVLGATLTASFIAPLVEETIKGLAVLGILLFWRSEIDSLLDGIIYGAMVGLGFALVENVFYFVSVYQEGGLEGWGFVVFLRSIVFGLNHALFTSMIGLGVAVARLTRNPLVKVVAPVMGWATAVFLHFLHNFSVSLGNPLCLLALLTDWGGVLLTLLIIVWALWQERRWLRHYLAEEVALGNVTSLQYITACSGRARVQRHLGLLLDYGPTAYWRDVRHYHRLSELAYKKHHYALFGDAQSQALIERLREIVRGE